MTPLQQLKQSKRTLIERHVRPLNSAGLFQVMSTLLPLGLMWWAAAALAEISLALVLLPLIGMSLLLVRAFVLLHECGHGSLFRSQALNRSFGYLLGVLTGMPQAVWSVRHLHHHATNGNWSKYRGPLNTLSIHEFAALSAAEQCNYVRLRRMAMAPLAGFLYVVLNPRLNWLRGSLTLARRWIGTRLSGAGEGKEGAPPAISYPNCWAQCPQDYRHMALNNLGLIALGSALAWAVGPWLYLACAVLSMTLAGAAGIVLFTVQHNFDQAYASEGAGWDYDQAALEGTSFLVLPGWLNWVTANIGYHHIHHLSARIPCYCLADCHREFEALFSTVRRIRLSEIPASLHCILWDARAQRITSVAAYRASLSPQATVASPAELEPQALKQAA